MVWPEMLMLMAFMAETVSCDVAVALPVDVSMARSPSAWVFVIVPDFVLFFGLILDAGAVPLVAVVDSSVAPSWLCSPRSALAPSLLDWSNPAR